MLFRSKAPLRISFCGGGTDVSPYRDERGGVVLSATINKYAYGTLAPREDNQITVRSLDYDTVVRYRADDTLPYDGNLDLVKAVVREMNCLSGARGLDLMIRSDAPPGSGLGSSSTMMVALIGLFKQWLHRPMDPYEVAEVAYRIERIDLGIKGGRQDQYAACFGGFNLIEFNRDEVVVNPLNISRDIINELEGNLLLCYTGRTRLSANIIDAEIRNYRDGDPETLEALDELKVLTREMKDALLRGRLQEFGSLLDEAWKKKKRVASQISNAEIDALYAAGRSAGAVGGKLLGAGGGGHLLLYCDFEKKPVVAKAVEALGGQIVPFGFETRGLQVWSVQEAPGADVSSFVLATA